MKTLEAPVTDEIRDGAVTEKALPSLSQLLDEAVSSTSIHTVLALLVRLVELEAPALAQTPTTSPAPVVAVKPPEPPKAPPAPVKVVETATVTDTVDAKAADPAQ
jgi:hypothetical protein